MFGSHYLNIFLKRNFLTEKILINILNSRLKKNIGYSVFAQVISLLVAFIVNLFLPKFIDTIQYGLWQTFVLYSSYVGILHFGILDGLMLRYAEYDYDTIDKRKLSSQFQVLLLVISFLGLSAYIISFWLNNEVSKIILILVASSIISKNVFTYVSYTFQLTNRIHLYTRLIIFHRLIYLIFIVSILYIGLRDFYYFCLAEIFAEILSTLVCSFWNKGLYFSKVLSTNIILNELKENFLAGSPLLIANWASMLLLGSARMIIEWRWDITVFALFSFAVSVTNLFLTLITSISIVLYPSMRRMERNVLPKIYVNVRNQLSLILFWSMLFYYPISSILIKFLPKYSISLKYLGLLLPIIVYSSKITLLTNNYLKTYRKEKKILKINILSLVFGIFGFLIGAYFFNNIISVIIAILISVIFKTLISELEVKKLFPNNLDIKPYGVEIFLTIIFILTTQLTGIISGFIIYLLFMVLYTTYLMHNSKKLFTVKLDS